MTIAGKALFFARVREGSVCPFDYSFLNRHNEYRTEMVLELGLDNE